MATETIPLDRRDLNGGLADTRAAASRGATSVAAVLLGAWRLLASLKLTVVLLAFGTLIVFVGTLAQAEIDMWEVIDRYFASYIAWTDINVFFPHTFFPTMERLPAILLPLPGGALIGLAMILNLLAAHSVRFRVQARGIRLLTGLLVTLAGIAATGLIISLGHNKEGLQGEPFFEWSQLWAAIKIGLMVGWLALLFPLARLLFAQPQSRRLQLPLLAGTQVGLTLLLIWMFTTRAELSPSSLRILWQLLQGLLAGVILLVGCLLLFRKRAGVVLIHGGILLMMFGQFIATRYNVEERMSIREGESVQYAEDIRTTELAVIDSQARDYDEVVVVPREMLVRSAEGGERISDPRLPFDLEVRKYFKNSRLRNVKGGESNPATAGLGLKMVADNVRPSSGADAGGAVDEAAAYVTFFDKESGQALGTHLMAMRAAFAGQTEQVAAQGKPYQLALRFKRSYKPYALTLKDVVREDYSGTDSPRHYASVVQIVDPERDVNREAKIWMNNPLRYAGETFYQSSYDPGQGGVEVTGLQVVRNTGWMIPYVACMIVATGLIAHFWGTLLRFLLRRERDLYAYSDPVDAVPEPRNQARESKRQERDRKRGGRLDTLVKLDTNSRVSHVVTSAVVIAGAVWLLSGILPRPSADRGGIDLRSFGELPVLFEGRVKPLDTVARNTLRVISNRESYYDDEGKPQPAIRWLADVLSESDAALEHRVFRIDNLDVLQVLGLERRRGFRYAIREFRDRIDDFENEVSKASAKRSQDERSLTVFDRKILELDGRLRTYLLVAAPFRTLPLPDKIPTAADMEKNPEEASQSAAVIRHLLEQAPAREQELDRMNPPRAIPLADGSWAPLATAYTKAYLSRLRNELLGSKPAEPVNAGAVAFRNMLKAYGDRNAGTFQRELAKVQEYLGTVQAEQYHPAKVHAEAFYNRFNAFFHAQWSYFLAFVLVALGWLVGGHMLNRAAFWLIFVTFLAHTFAIVARIYISGRPPVTTLYSSAIFIGWAAVVSGLALEVLFRLGVGNVVASVCGFSTLIVAGFLSTSGETMPVLQAVLDTQFWLSTHVVSIALGYSATFVAGLLGVIYVLAGVATRGLTADMGRILTRMIYGTLCFALLFSFVGTVLGGLWADDSWGRFWGWDPKENGALIIVLWNALVLHARWDGMVRQRGLALLAVAGNITTSWSWFGVNELGVGLHSYGFTEGVLLALGLFVLSQLVVIGLALVPRDRWRSAEAVA